MNIKERLFSLADSDYKSFHSRLMPTVDPNKIIGVRIPHLRRLAKELNGSSQAEKFLSEIPHRYYEEDNLHAFLIEKIRDFDACVLALENFLPYVDNWATCDCMRPKVLKSQPQKYLKIIKKWLKSKHIYTVRFAVGSLLTYYLDEEFQAEHLELVADIESDEYYIKMMKAWYFATALAKHYNEALPYITEKRMDKWTHNKTIQKAVESYRLNDEQKEYLKKFKALK